MPCVVADERRMTPLPRRCSIRLLDDAIVEYVAPQLGCTLPEARGALHLCVVRALDDLLQAPPVAGVDILNMSEMSWLMAFNIEPQGDFSMSNLMGPLQAFVHETLSVLLFGQDEENSPMLDAIDAWKNRAYATGALRPYWQGSSPAEIAA
jgi:hypothetical protein